MHCAVSRSTPVPFSVSASASAESLSASTAEDACPGVGVTHGCVTSFTSTEGDSIFTPCALHTCRSPATPSWARPLCLHYARLPSTPSSRPTSPRPPRLLHGSIHLVSQTLRRGAGGRLAKPNTPAQYIYQKTHVYMFPNQIPPAHVALNGKLDQEGDSGSPVYALRWGPGGYVMWAYGVLSGKSTDSTIVAPIDWIYVKVSR